MSIELYSTLTTYGDQILLSPNLHDTDGFVEWTEENFEYVRYNPRKNVDRWGLSITSADGGLSGRPDLDSLKEYNKEHGTNWLEDSFNVPTPVLQNKQLRKLINPIQDKIFRSHILKLNPGGFFPPHRDFYGKDFSSFRIIVPLVNFNAPRVHFILDNKILNWTAGHMHFLNTAKVHTLFNASFDPSYWIVLNVKTVPDTVDFVIKNVEFA